MNEMLKAYIFAQVVLNAIFAIIATLSWVIK